jgi:selenium-binding protein 1
MHTVKNQPPNRTNKMNDSRLIHLARPLRHALAGVAALCALASPPNSRADETCSSPYLARIEGQEEFVYVWTLGVEGLGDGADKLVTLDVKPGSPNYGKVISSHSLGKR